MQITCYGPNGVACALGNVDTQYLGIFRVKRFRSGKIVSNGIGYGETTTHRYYTNGNRVSRKDFMSFLRKHVEEGQKVIIEGPVA